MYQVQKPCNQSDSHNLDYGAGSNFELKIFHPEVEIPEAPLLAYGEHGFALRDFVSYYLKSVITLVMASVFSLCGPINAMFNRSGIKICFATS